MKSALPEKFPELGSERACPGLINYEWAGLYTVFFRRGEGVSNMKSALPRKFPELGSERACPGLINYEWA